MSDVRFTDQQQHAIDHARGTMLVSAGAGSGKTQVLVARIANALTQGPGGGEGLSVGVPLDVGEILTITFTRKAANELKERVANELRKRRRFDLATRIEEMWISTIHGMCSRILRAHALECGIDPTFKVLADNEEEPLRIEAFRQAIDAYGAEYGAAKGADQGVELFSSFSYNGLYDAVSALYPYLVAGKDLAPYRDSTEGTNPVVARHAEELIVLTKHMLTVFTRLKEERNALDYDDLEQRTLLLLEGSAEVRLFYQEKFKLVHVDEFQDTNEIQLRLIRAIAGDNLYTVGDAQQSIYRFRGADLDVYRQYSSDIEESSIERLQHNFRSNESILALSNEIFGQAELFEGMFLELKHGRDEGEAAKKFPLPAGSPRISIDLFECARGKQATLKIKELRQIYAKKMAAQIRSLIDSGIGTGDIAVLFRSSTAMKLYLDALLAAGVDAVISGGGKFYQERAVGLFENFLRVLANPRDERALLLVLSSDMFRLSDTTLYALTRETHRRREAEREASDSSVSTTLYDVMLEEASTPRLLDVRELAGDLADLRQAVDVLEESFVRLGRDDLSGVVSRAIEASGLDLHYFGQGSLGKQQYAFILKLLAKVDDFERTEGTGPAGFAESLKQSRELNSKEGLSALPNEENIPVRLMTIHSAKGLEFPVVFLPEIQTETQSAGTVLHVDESVTPHEVLLQLPGIVKTGYGENSKGDARFQELKDNEERADFEEYARLLYVAITRAREALYISGFPHRKVTEEGSKKALGAPLFDAFIKGKMEFPEWEEGAYNKKSCTLKFSRAGSAGIEPVTCTLHTIASDYVEDDEVEGQVSRPDPTPAAVDISTLAMSHSGAEKEEPLYPSRISYSGFSAYEECGRRFEAERLLHVGELQLKEDREEAVAFGSAFHAVAEYYARVGEPSAERIRAIAAYHDITSEDEVKRLETAFRVWTTSDVARELFEEGSRPLPEIPFAIYLGENGEGLTLDGSIDLMKTRDGAATIIDYKTGGTTEDAYETLEERYRLQAECYALVPLRAGNERAEIVFVRPEVLERGESGAQPVMQRVCFTFTQEDRARIESELLAIFAKMKRGEYEPLSSYSQEVCGSCPIRGTICEIGKGH